MTDQKWKSTDDYWENRYQNSQTGWDRGEAHPALLQWLNSGTLEPCKILVPGCGRGYEVLKLAAAGFDVTAVDFADTPIKSLSEELEKAGNKAELVQSDFLEFQSGTKFDAAYEQTCLCAIEPESRTRYAAKIHQLLKPGGLFLVLFMQTGDRENGPPFHCEIDEMNSLFHATSWDWQTDTGTRFEHPAGSIYEMAFTLVKK